MLLSGIPLFRVMSEDSALLTSKKNRFLVSRPDDVSSSLDAHLSTVPSVRTTCHTVRTPDRPSIICSDDVHSRLDLYCFEKLLFQLAFIQTFRQPVRTHLCDRSVSDSFQVQNKGRLLQPSGRRGFPSRRAHTRLDDSQSWSGCTFNR
jgi:hypothetical protein